MRAIIQHYRIYKDRFLLSLNISILLHLLVIALFYLLPTPEKKTILRPISLGVLQSKSIPQTYQQPQTTQPQQQTQPQTQTKPAQPEIMQRIPSQITPSIPNQTQEIPQQTTQQATQSPPSTDINLQDLRVPQEQNATFNPLATQTPSLTQSLRQQDDNAKVEELPQIVQDELYKLYGTELNNMSKEQKDYLAESYFMNYEVFQQTADRMGYPKLAAYLKQQGNGVIEFTLYPDGHIDNVKIIVSTKFEALDDSMKQVVELSAKSLKRPPKPVTVRLGGTYRITEY